MFKPKILRAKYNIIRYDVATQKEEIIETKLIQIGDTIKLRDNSDYSNCDGKPSDIKIKDIKDEYVEILREKITYNEKEEGYEEVKEELDENKKYDETFGMIVDKYNYKDNYSHPLCAQARYYYSMSFTK